MEVKDSALQDKGDAPIMPPSRCFFSNLIKPPSRKVADLYQHLDSLLSGTPNSKRIASEPDVIIFRDYYPPALLGRQ